MHWFHQIFGFTLYLCQAWAFPSHENNIAGLLEVADELHKLLQMLQIFPVTAGTSGQTNGGHWCTKKDKPQRDIHSWTESDPQNPNG